MKKKRKRSDQEIEAELLRTDPNFRKLKERIEYHKAKAEEERRAKG